MTGPAMTAAAAVTRPAARRRRGTAVTGPETRPAAR